MMQQLLLELSPRPEPTLDNYVPGRNGAALQALREIANGNGTERFIYLWGEPGSGRTHLLRSLKAATGDEVMVADDVQLLPVENQIALFDQYNRVRAAGGALVASGNAAREDLRSRLAWGLAFQLHPLSDAEKAAALREHARGRSLNLPEDVIVYLLRHAERDMASLIGVLDALDRHSLEHKRPITLPLVREAMQHAKS